MFQNKTVLSYAITGGLLWGCILFIVNMISYYTGYAHNFLHTIPESVYPGYHISPIGGVIGFIYGFCDVFIGIHILCFIHRRVSLWVNQ